MSIIATCGHQLKEVEGLGVDCSMQSYSREGNRAVDYVTYCFKCYKEAIAEDLVLLTEEAEDEWLMEKAEEK